MVQTLRTGGRRNAAGLGCKQNLGRSHFPRRRYVDTEPEALTYLTKYGIDFYNGPDMGTKISHCSA